MDNTCFLFASSNETDGFISLVEKLLKDNKFVNLFHIYSEKKNTVTNDLLELRKRYFNRLLIKSVQVKQKSIINFFHWDSDPVDLNKEIKDFVTELLPHAKSQSYHIFCASQMKESIETILMNLDISHSKIYLMEKTKE